MSKAEEHASIDGDSNIRVVTGECTVPNGLQPQAIFGNSFSSFSAAIMQAIPATYCELYPSKVAVGMSDAWVVAVSLNCGPGKEIMMWTLIFHCGITFGSNKEQKRFHSSIQQRMKQPNAANDSMTTLDLNFKLGRKRVFALAYRSTCCLPGSERIPATVSALVSAPEWWNGSLDSLSGDQCNQASCIGLYTVGFKHAIGLEYAQSAAGSIGEYRNLIEQLKKHLERTANSV